MQTWSPECARKSQPRPRITGMLPQPPVPPGRAVAARAAYQPNGTAPDTEPAHPRAGPGDGQAGLAGQLSRRRAGSGPAPGTPRFRNMAECCGNGAARTVEGSRSTGRFRGQSGATLSPARPYTEMPALRPVTLGLVITDDLSQLPRRTRRSDQRPLEGPLKRLTQRGIAMRVSWRVNTRPMIGADVGDMRWVPRFKGGLALTRTAMARDLSCSRSLS